MRAMIGWFSLLVGATLTVAEPCAAQDRRVEVTSFIGAFPAEEYRISPGGRGYGTPDGGFQ
jgi:hypothetical protein